MREADYESRRERREREREAGEAFQKILREHLEAGGPRLPDLLDRPAEKEGGYDAA